MRYLGHIGIALATSIAAYVSLYQYVHGLKKRGHWQISRTLKIKLLKIIGCSALMGYILYLVQYGLFKTNINWLAYNLFIKTAIYGILCILGLASFLIIAKLTKTLNITDILKLLKRRG